MSHNNYRVTAIDRQTREGEICKSMPVPTQPARATVLVQQRETSDRRSDEVAGKVCEAGHKFIRKAKTWRPSLVKNMESNSIVTAAPDSRNILHRL